MRPCHKTTARAIRNTGAFRGLILHLPRVGHPRRHQFITGVRRQTAARATHGRTLPEPFGRAAIASEIPKSRRHRPPPTRSLRTNAHRPDGYDLAGSTRLVLFFCS
jgi:hypothetical protein